MLRGIITRNVDAYVSNKRLTKGTKVNITKYKSFAYYAVEYEKSIYLVPKDAVKIEKEKHNE